MATYVIGDVQGCYDELQLLLAKIEYDPQHDQLGFVGDLVSRGPSSLTTLRFIKELPNVQMVLGNHDLHCLALACGAIERDETHALYEIATAPDKDEIIAWLRQQPLLYHNQQDNYVQVHAGIPPQWDLATAKQRAAEISAVLQSDDYRDFLKNMYGDMPVSWDDTLQGHERLRYITNAFTRMRFCAKDGELDVTNKTEINQDPKKFKPWYEWIDPECDILFGHWAALEGRCDYPHLYALDTACVWGKQLTALRIEDKQCFSVDALQQYHSIDED